MKKKVYSIVFNSILILIIFLLIGLSIRHYNQNLIRCRSSLNKFEETNNNINDALNELNNLRIFELQTEGVKLNNLCLIDNEMNPKDLLSLVDCNTIILRLWEGSCNPCLKDNIISLKEFDNEKVVILGSFLSFASYKAFTTTYDIENIYMVDNELLSSNIPMEQHQLLYYFQISNDLSIHHVFVPLKGFNEFTQMYLKRVCEKQE